MYVKKNLFPSAVMKLSDILLLRDRVCAIQHEAAEQDLS